jgi:hypothetical protein
VKLHVPLVHAAIAFAGAVQAVVQLPQWFTSEARSMQLESQRVGVGFEQPLAHV